jgi:hypothetical protein
MLSVFLSGKRIFSAVFFTLAIGFAIHSGILSAEPASAGLGESAAGFAWGGGAATNGSGYDGIGWLSFNNLSDGSAVNYGVNIPLTDGNLSGYAWSEYYGWISFNAADLAGCPGGTCTATRTGAAITGWARFIAIRQSPITAGRLGEPVGHRNG